MENRSSYDVVIAGAGHNGLVAACYLGMAGLRVLMLEKNEVLGGATRSDQVFAGVEARVSVYSYLISLFPQKILSDLGIRFEVRRRAVGSYTPLLRGGQPGGLLISNVAEEVTRQSFIDCFGDDREYRRYQKLDGMLATFAEKVWPTLLEPLPSRAALAKRFETPEERKIWEYMVEKPLACLIEDHLADDAVRGAVFTDAKIGVPTYPEDPTLLQNRTFLYHVIGQGTGEWRVPMGGMGHLVAALEARARGLGVVIRTSAEVTRVDPNRQGCDVYYRQAGKEAAVRARFVLFNTASNVLNRCLPGAYAEPQVEGAVFKINMVLRKLPAMKDGRVSARDAFTGTLHLNEGYEQMKRSYQHALGASSTGSAALPGEMYCHSLTDPSILSPELQEQGYQTLTLFGLDVPYHWFTQDHERQKAEITHNYLRSLDPFVVEPLENCLALDASGAPCIDAKSPLDLEQSLGLPAGNIFHGNLSWPFAESEAEAGAWGVETNVANVLLCGSSARRGGAVSGIPGHHAAMRVLEMLKGK